MSSDVLCIRPTLTRLSASPSGTQLVHHPCARAGIYTVSFALRLTRIRACARTHSKKIFHCSHIKSILPSQTRKRSFSLSGYPFFFQNFFFSPHKSHWFPWKVTSACQMLLGLWRIILRMSTLGRTRAVRYVGEKVCVCHPVLIFLQFMAMNFNACNLHFWCVCTIITGGISVSRIIHLCSASLSTSRVKI